MPAAGGRWVWPSVELAEGSVRPRPPASLVHPGVGPAWSRATSAGPAAPLPGCPGGGTVALALGGLGGAHSCAESVASRDPGQPTPRTCPRTAPVSLGICSFLTSEVGFGCVGSVCVGLFRRPPPRASRGSSVRSLLLGRLGPRGRGPEPGFQEPGDTSGWSFSLPLTSAAVPACQPSPPAPRAVFGQPLGARVPPRTRPAAWPWAGWTRPASVCLSVAGFLEERDEVMACRPHAGPKEPMRRGAQQGGPAC